MLAVLIPRLLKKLLKGRMELYLDIESGIFRNRAGDENMNLCGVRLVRRQDVPVSLSFLGRELEAGRVTLAAYHKRNGQLLAYQEGQITGGAVEMVVDFDTQEIRGGGQGSGGQNYRGAGGCAGGDGGRERCLSFSSVEFLSGAGVDRG